MQHTALIQRIKRVAPTAAERAAIFGWSLRYQFLIEAGFLPRVVHRLMRAGVLVVPPETDDAHETNDEPRKE